MSSLPAYLPLEASISAYRLHLEIAQLSTSGCAQNRLHLCVPMWGRSASCPIAISRTIFRHPLTRTNQPLILTRSLIQSQNQNPSRPQIPLVTLLYPLVSRRHKLSGLLGAVTIRWTSNLTASNEVTILLYEKVGSKSYLRHTFTCSVPNTSLYTNTLPVSIPLALDNSFACASTVLCP